MSTIELKTIEEAYYLEDFIADVRVKLEHEIYDSIVNHYGEPKFSSIMEPMYRLSVAIESVKPKSLEVSFDRQIFDFSFLDEFCYDYGEVIDYYTNDDLLRVIKRMRYCHD